jgi:alanine racemase
VWEDFHLDLLEAAARQLALPPRSVRVHLEIDTGMSRQGVRLDGSSLEQMLDRFQLNSPLLLEGVATHFSAPEVIDDNATMKQLHRFEAAIELVTAKGLQPRWIHAGNSANELRGEPLLQLKRAAAQAGARFMWRPGLALYGYAPRFTNHGEAVNLAALPPATLDPVLSWKTRVTSIRTIEAGEAAGYNSTFRAAQRSHLALAPMGYADGFPRLLSNRGHMLVNGHRAPVAGRVSMDQTILDVTGLPHVSVGDEVVVIGSQGDESISASDIADLTGTIPYEVLCGIAARVPRILVD